VGQDGEYNAVRDVYEFAWSGTRYCDLNMNEPNLALIKDDLANGARKDDFIAVTAHLVHQCSRLIMLSEDLPVEKPLSWEDATQVAKRWYMRKTDEMANPDGKQTIVIEVKKEEPCRE